jgi:hypothetical protein
MQRLISIVSDWYALNPQVRRIWVYPDGAGDMHVVVALAPVGDSDDTSPIWLAKGTGWQRQLQRLIGRRVHLEWFDADTGVEPRVFLASIAWREVPEEPRPTRAATSLPARSAEAR